MPRITFDKVCAVVDKIGCGGRLARELLILAGGDVDLVIESAERGGQLSMTKAYILDARFDKSESVRKEDDNGIEDQGR